MRAVSPSFDRTFLKEFLQYTVHHRRRRRHWLRILICCGNEGALQRSATPLSSPPRPSLTPLCPFLRYASLVRMEDFPITRTTRDSYVKRISKHRTLT